MSAPLRSHGILRTVLEANTPKVVPEPIHYTADDLKGRLNKAISALNDGSDFSDELGALGFGERFRSNMFRTKNELYKGDDEIPLPEEENPPTYNESPKVEAPAPSVTEEGIAEVTKWGEILRTGRQEDSRTWRV